MTKKKKIDPSKQLDRALARVLAHTDSRAEYIPNIERAARFAARLGGEGKQRYAGRALKMIAHETNLYEGMEHLRSNGGNAPGPDNLALTDFKTKSEAFRFCRDLRDDIKNQSYRPGDVRIKKIKKASGKGYRKIAIPNVSDKIIYRGIKQVVEPLVDHSFKPWSFGYRKGLNRGDAVAKAVTVSERLGLYAWGRADIQDAFDNVPLDRLLVTFGKYFPSPVVEELVRHCVKIDQRDVGLEQGSPLSPLLMNMYLHHHVDRLWEKRAGQRKLIRYADDFVIMGRSQKETESGLAILDDLLTKAGLQRKPDSNPIASLDGGDRAVMLGFEIFQREGRIVVEVAEKSLERFKDKLMELGPDQHDAVAAYNKLLGWCQEQGPAYSAKYAKRVIRQLTNCLKKVGLADRSVKTDCPKPVRVCDQQEWLVTWKEAHVAWLERVGHPLRPQ